MSYNFDTPINRRNTNSYKWNVKETELPMWVADMDFKTAPEIIKAMENRISHGVFGYEEIPQEWYEAYISWWKNRHGFEIQKEWLIFSTGVVPTISSIVRKLTTVGEKIVIQTPIYNIFFNSIINNGRVVLENPLKYKNGEYCIDFDSLEDKLSDPQTTLMILCNPHNPIGKIWNKDTLAMIGELCYKHGVIVVSDEIHCDLTHPDTSYIPFASVSDNCKENSITCIAPTKAFNLAGLQTSAVVVPNEKLRYKVWRGLNTDEVAEPNSLAVTATIAAFSYGTNWLNELQQYIAENKKFVTEYIKKEIPQINVALSEATYLLWLDCSKFDISSEHLANFIRENTGLYLSAGKQFGGNGDKFLRMNVACPHKTLIDGLERLKKRI